MVSFSSLNPLQLFFRIPLTPRLAIEWFKMPNDQIYWVLWVVKVILPPSYFLGILYFELPNHFLFEELIRYFLGMVIGKSLKLLLIAYIIKILLEKVFHTYLTFKKVMNAVLITGLCMLLAEIYPGKGVLAGVLWVVTYVYTAYLLARCFAPAVKKEGFNRLFMLMIIGGGMQLLLYLPFWGFDMRVY